MSTLKLRKKYEHLLNNCDGPYVTGKKFHSFKIVCVGAATRTQESAENCYKTVAVVAVVAVPHVRSNASTPSKLHRHMNNYYM